MKIHYRSPANRSQRGFTLVEIAISFLIIALLLGGALMTLGAQSNVRAVVETQRTLQQAQEALLGFAAAQGRLPCPATAASSGVEVSSEGGGCPTIAGFYPAATLGIGPTDKGFLVDAWGHRIRYAVTTANDSAFTTVDKMRVLGAGALTPDLHVCRDAVCTTSLTDRAVAIVFSTGENNPNPNTGDEAKNTDSSSTFISHEPRPAGAPGGEFDDIVTWLSPYTLYNRMIAAGAL